jgi:hypothetical protein
MVVHAYNPRAQKDEAGGSQDGARPGVDSETLPQKISNRRFQFEAT